MNTKVEEALWVLDGAERSFVVLQQLVVMVKANADYIAAANEMRAARTTLAAHIAQQDATIARLTAEKREVAEIAFDCCQKYYDMDSVPLTVIRDAALPQGAREMTANKTDERYSREIIAALKKLGAE